MRLHRLSSVLSVSIRHTYTRNGYFYFQRAVPLELQSIEGKATIKQALKTTDPIVASRMVEKINTALEARWARLRSDPTGATQDDLSKARQLLDDWGLKPRGEGKPDPEAAQLLQDQFDDGDEDWPSRLTLVQRKALDLLHHGHKPTLSDALQFYFERHAKGDDKDFRKTSTYAVNQFIEAVGDKVFAEITRNDVHTWLVWSVRQRGQGEGTLKRRLNSLCAVATMFIRENELDIPNRFSSHRIPKGAKKPVKRETFTLDELRTVQGEAREKDDDIRHMVAMLSDTCTRPAEIAGLRLADIVLEDPIPHICIVEYSGRTLKTDSKDDGASERKHPLVGAALWAARRIVEKATPGQVFAFPRYIKGGVCKNGSASAGGNKWLRSLDIDKSLTLYSFRHTTADRLREVGCPEDVRHQLGGWARKDIAAQYGHGYSLRVTHEYLAKIVLKIGDKVD